MYVWLSPFAVYLKLSQLLIGYTLIKNKKFKKKAVSATAINGKPASPAVNRN